MLINKKFTDIFIDNMMFHPDYLDWITQAQLLASFVPTIDSSKDIGDVGHVSRYAIIIKQHQSVSVGCTIFGFWTVVPPCETGYG